MNSIKKAYFFGDSKEYQSLPRYGNPPRSCKRLSKQYNLILDYEKQLLIIEDLRKQIDERIRYYNSEEAITEKVKKDISGGLNQYLSKLSESESES